MSLGCRGGVCDPPAAPGRGAHFRGSAASSRGLAGVRRPLRPTGLEEEHQAARSVSIPDGAHRWQMAALPIPCVRSLPVRRQINSPARKQSPRGTSTGGYLDMTWRRKSRGHRDHSAQYLPAGAYLVRRRAWLRQTLPVDRPRRPLFPNTGPVCRGG